MAERDTALDKFVGEMKLIKDLKIRGGLGLRSGAIRQRFSDDVGIGLVNVGDAGSVSRSLHDSRLIERGLAGQYRKKKKGADWESRGHKALPIEERIGSNQRS